MFALGILLAPDARFTRFRINGILCCSGRFGASMAICPARSSVSCFWLSDDRRFDGVQAEQASGGGVHRCGCARSCCPSRGRGGHVQRQEVPALRSRTFSK
jgi:hypothetical protein